LGYTLAEKILMHNTKSPDIKPGNLITADADRVMIHDLFAPFVIEKFREMGFKRVWDPDRIVFVFDHLVPASTLDDNRHHHIAEAFAEEQGIEHIHRSDGVCHQLMPELRYALPGNVIFGTDSHTTTYGAVGAFATGIGYTEMAAILGTGRLWLKVPETLKFNVEGKFPEGVFSKDLILRIIGDIKANGATYKSMEFSGSAISGLSVSARLTLSNMAVEAGAKVGLIEPDEKTFEYCGLSAAGYDYLKSDPDAEYERVYDYDAAKLEPVVACPSNVDNIRNVGEAKGIKINQAFLGSCTNGRADDLEIAANILRGRKIAPFIKLIVTPASRSVYLEAVNKGVISALIEAGAVVTQPSCGLCCGRSGGVVSDGERVIATNNRNFLGRMGSSKSEVYLASPATVAASALTGEITDPRNFL